MSDQIRLDTRDLQRFRPTTFCVRCEGGFDYCHNGCGSVHTVMFENGTINRVCHFCVFIVENVPAHMIDNDIRAEVEKRRNA